MWREIMTDEEFEKKLDMILEINQTEGRTWLQWHDSLSPFILAKSICILARAVNGGEP